MLVVILPSLLSLSLSLSFLFCVRAQSTDGTSLLNALQNAGLTSLASAAAIASQTPEGQKLIAALMNSSQPYTIFAPDNAACKFSVWFFQSSARPRRLGVWKFTSPTANLDLWAVFGLGGLIDVTTVDHVSFPLTCSSVS